LDIEDLRRCNQLLEQNLSEDELEGLLELAGKSNGKITFENFMEFLSNDN
jgi:Ca2+-binding EF-hand superfamily protein